MTDFLTLVIEGFAQGAPAHHHLVFKAHPLEDGRAPIAREIRRLTALAFQGQPTGDPAFDALGVVAAEVGRTDR